MAVNQYTTYQHFVGELSLPNTLPSKPEGEDLGIYIVKYEHEYLFNLFGVELGQLVEGHAPTPDESFFINLANGTTFTSIGGEVMEMKGFKNIDSPIAEYIYYKYLYMKSISIMGVGGIVMDAENGSRASLEYEMVRAWNSMAEKNIIIHEYVMSYIEYTYNSVVDNTTILKYIGQTIDPYLSDTPIKANQNLFKKINTFNI